jgi:hypothetical protein
VAQARTDFADGLYSIVDAARACNLKPQVIRAAIKRGDLPAFLIGGRQPSQAGAGLGYRMKIADVERWFLGLAKKEEATT